MYSSYRNPKPFWSNKEKLVYFVGGLVFIVLLVFLLYQLVNAFGELGQIYAKNASYHSACLAAGYSDYKGDAVGNYYCYRIVNGTEELVPVERVIE